MSETDTKEGNMSVERISYVPIENVQMKLIFTIFGACSLLAWNAIISNLSFFMRFQGKYDPDVSFSFLNFSLNIVFQFLMVFKKQLFPLKPQLIVGIICSIISLIALPLIVINSAKNSGVGFTFTAIVILFQGFVNAICCSGFFSLTSIFPIKMIISFSTGQGVSAIVLNIIQFIILFTVGYEEDDEIKKGAIIFFAISALFLLICLFILIIAYKTDYFKYYLERSEKSEETTEPGSADFKNTEEESLVSTGETKEVSFMQLIKMLLDINILTAVLYIITFVVFPNVCFNPPLFGVKFTIRSCVVVTIYNVFDTLGRIIIEKIKPTKQLTYIIVLSRIILVVTLYLNTLDFNENLLSIMLIINVTLLGLTNGMGTSLCMGIAPSLVPDEIKGKAGSSVSFFIIVGIFLGSCLAFGMKKITPNPRP